MSKSSSARFDTIGQGGLRDSNVSARFYHFSWRLTNTRRWDLAAEESTQLDCKMLRNQGRTELEASSLLNYWPGINSEKGNVRVSSCVLSGESSKTMDTQMALAKLSGSQNQTKRHEHENRACRHKSCVCDRVGDTGGWGRSSHNHHTDVRNWQGTNLTNLKIGLGLNKVRSEWIQSIHLFSRCWTVFCISMESTGFQYWLMHTTFIYRDCWGEVNFLTLIIGTMSIIQPSHIYSIIIG